jgi:hypothetical protein
LAQEGEARRRCGWCCAIKRATEGASGCHWACNGTGSRRSGASNGIDVLVAELSSAEAGVVVFASASGKQYALEDDKWGNGAFTKALLEGLAGKAAYQGDGRVTLNMLDLYLSELVKKLTDGQQSPVTAKPQTIQDFPVVIIR